MTTRYHPSFHQGIDGNKLKVGEDLVIKINGKPMYIIGQLFKRKSLFRKNLIQIEQTGTKQNPEKNQITFEMKERVLGEIKPMPPGKYMIRVYTYLSDLGGKRWTDKFEVE